MTPAQFKEAVCSRLKELRLKAGYDKMTEFAKVLGIPETTYPKYESRSLLPHRYIARVCELTGCDEHYFLTGQITSYPAEIMRLIRKIEPYQNLLDNETIDEMIAYMKIKQSRS